MQDRFKFRFYDKYKKIMIKPSPEMSDTELKNVCTTYGNDEWWWCIEAGMPTIFKYFDTNEYNKKDFVIMQCTGLKDKNGKLIYEGDILIQKEENWGPTKKLVIWEEDGGYLGLKDLKESFFGVVTFHRFGYTYEVIGNIYENPELLEVSNEH